MAKIEELEDESPCDVLSSDSTDPKITSDETRENNNAHPHENELQDQPAEILHSEEVKVEDVEEVKVQDVGDALDSEFHDCEGSDSCVLKDPVQAQQAKEAGNRHFSLKEFDEAVKCYTNAISFCPDGDDFNEQRAVYFGNRAACLLHQKQYDQVVEDCTQSLKLKPDYVKVLMRRAQANEILEKFQDALNDIKKVCELDPSIRKAQVDQVRLQKICDEQLEQLKEETMGKLKDLGNSVLGYFGMSMDNFQMDKDPNTGGYNISMKS